MAIARGRRATAAVWSGGWPLAVLLLLVLFTSWAVDDAIGFGSVALLAGAAGALFAATLGSRIRALRRRLGVAAMAGSVAAVALAAWQAQVTPGTATLDRLGTALQSSLTAAWAGHAPGAVGLSLGLAVLAWANAYVATYGLLVERRIRESVVLLGVPLLVAMLFTPSPDIGLLVLFAAGTMLLNLWAAEQRRDVAWRRRTLAPEGDVTNRIRRVGTLATVGVVVLAWVLGTVAVAAPLGGVLRQAESFIRDTTSGLGSWPGIGANVGAPVFAHSLTISDEWNPTDEPVIVVAGDLGQRYLRAMTYDHFTGTGWSQSLAAPRQVVAGQLLFREPALELGNGWRESKAEWRITAQQSLATLILPVDASSVSRSVQLEETAGAHFVATIRASVDAGGTYEAKGSNAVAGPDQLAAAGIGYPAELPDGYLSLAGVSQPTIERAAQVAGQGTPYAKADALATYLRGSAFSYAERVHMPAGANVVDWLLFDSDGHAGFCEQYASAMVVMARAVGIPARLASGYAFGTRQADGTLLFRAADKHVWAELYFPGYGWQVFEATPGKRGPDRRSTLGGATGSASAIASPLQRSPRELTEGGDPNAQSRMPQQLPAAAILAVLIALALGIAGFSAGVLRARRPPVDMTPVQVWQRLTLAGARAGIPRQASQTPFEYAETLQRHVPHRSQEIASIADAVVVATYAPSGVSGPSAPEAWSGLRRTLARLELRRRLNGLRGHRDA